MMAFNNTHTNFPPGLNLKENHDVKLTTIYAAFALLSLVAVIARLASRRIKRVKLGTDDALLCFSWV